MKKRFRIKFWYIERLMEKYGEAEIITNSQDMAESLFGMMYPGKVIQTIGEVK